jgi:threonylcarbamoyladenosine tRNA methylthiotransferase MtaB
MALGISFRTFGCRLNQTETEAIAAAFAAAGARIVDFGQASDLVLFNTCTVTTKAEQKARREMRQALRLNADAVILATGCYAELDPQALHELAPRLVVIPGGRKGDLPGMARDLVAAAAEGLDLLEEARRLNDQAAGRKSDPFAFVPGDFRFRSRAALKIQDGCDNRCSYCRVCLARGKAVSLDPDEILSRARVIASAGIPEIVLTGVNLSQYSSGGLRFPDLLEFLCSQTEHVAFRISSYEPDRIDEAFLAAFADPRIRPHLHLPVQSGSDAILGAMGRSYRRNQVIAAVAGARAAKGDPFIGADIITGFPGESDDDFSATIDLLRETDPAWVHAFVFSPRPGTRAFAMKPRIPERVAVERARILARLAEEGKQRFAIRRVGTILEAVAEGAAPDADSGPEDLPVAGLPASDLCTAVSADYLRLSVRGVPAGISTGFSCRASGLAQDGTHDLIADYIASIS